MAELVAVRVRDCPDGTHPEGDSVWIRPTLSLAGGMVASGQLAEARIDPADAESEIDTKKLTLLWMETFVRYGAVSWNLHDPDAESPWPFDVERLLDNFDWSWPVADRADDFYREALLRPLAKGRPSSSRNGATAGSTSNSQTRTSKRSSSRRASAGQRSAANP